MYCLQNLSINLIEVNISNTVTYNRIAIEDNFIIAPLLPFPSVPPSLKPLNQSQHLPGDAITLVKKLFFKILVQIIQHTGIIKKQLEITLNF